MRKDIRVTYIIDMADGGELSLRLDNDSLVISRTRGYETPEGIVLPMSAQTITEIHDAINEIERQVIGK